MNIKVVLVGLLSVAAAALAVLMLNPEGRGNPAQRGGDAEMTANGAESGTLVGTDAASVAAATATQAALAPLLVGELKGLVKQSPRPLPKLPVLKPDNSAGFITELSPKVRLWNVWASWCGPCRVEMPALANLQAALGDDTFEVAALNVDFEGFPKAHAALDDWGVEGLVVYADPSLDAAQSIAKGFLPMSVVTDQDGMVLYEFIGTLDWDAPEVIAFFTALKAR